MAPSPVRRDRGPATDGTGHPALPKPASSIPRPAERARGYDRRRSSGFPTRAGRWAPSQAAGSPASLRSQRAQRSRRCTAAETSCRSTSAALSAGRVSCYRRSATTALRPVLPRSGLRKHTVSGGGCGNVHAARDQRLEGRRAAGVHPHIFCPFGQTDFAKIRCTVNILISLNIRYFADIHCAAKNARS